jgi:hypothetical protein
VSIWTCRFEPDLGDHYMLLHTEQKQIYIRCKLYPCMLFVPNCRFNGEDDEKGTARYCSVCVCGVLICCIGSPA